MRPASKTSKGGAKTVPPNSLARAAVAICVLHRRRKDSSVEERPWQRSLLGCSLQPAAAARRSDCWLQVNPAPGSLEDGVEVIRTHGKILGRPPENLGVEGLGSVAVGGGEFNPAKRAGRVFFDVWHGRSVLLGATRGKGRLKPIAAAFRANAAAPRRNCSAVPWSVAGRRRSSPGGKRER